MRIHELEAGKKYRMADCCPGSYIIPTENYYIGYYERNKWRDVFMPHLKHLKAEWEEVKDENN